MDAGPHGWDALVYVRAVLLRWAPEPAECDNHWTHKRLSDGLSTSVLEKKGGFQRS